MTGATSTAGGGGGAAARTLPVLQPRAFSSSTVLTKTVDICFIISFPSIVLLNFRFQSRHWRARIGTLLGWGEMWLESRFVDSGASVTRLHSSANANHTPKRREAK
jgi:hypothetical protein